MDFTTILAIGGVVVLVGIWVYYNRKVTSDTSECCNPEVPYKVEADVSPIQQVSEPRETPIFADPVEEPAAV